MQGAAGVIAGVLLVGLMSVAGFQLVPELRADSEAITLSSSSTRISVGNSPAATLNASSPVIEPTPTVTTIDTKSAHNVEESTVTLRGDVTLGITELDQVFFIYGYNQAALERAVSTARSYDDLVKAKPVSAGLKPVARSVKRSGEVSVRVGGLAPNTTYSAQLCAQIDRQLRCALAVQFRTTVGARRPGDVQLPTIRPVGEAFSSADEVTVGATVDMRDTIDGRVYLLYGQSRAFVSLAMQEDYSDIKQEDEFLQKTRLAVNVRGTLAVTRTIDNLADNTEHYYAICASYDGLRDGFVCSRLESFTTHDNDFGETPYVETFVPTAVGTQAIVAGEVGMSDFRNGQVFFVYGTDTDRIGRIGGETAMQNIRQSGDRQQRVLVDGDLDRSDSYRIRVTDLLPATTYGVRLCVEYKNQNVRYREALFVECGAVQLFVTN